MISLDTKTRVAVIQCNYRSNSSAKAALRMYKKEHIPHLRCDPFPISTITRLVKKFEKESSVCDAQKSGRPSFDKEEINQVGKEVSEQQNSSALGCSSSQVSLPNSLFQHFSSKEL